MNVLSNQANSQLILIYKWGIIPLWLLLSGTQWLREPIPIDETRYLTVAWEMWLRNDYLVPYLNGLPYSHKPPLLFWLMQLGWGIFGVNEWWPKLLGALAALTNLWLIRVLAQKLWPQQVLIGLTAPWILISCLLWTLFACSTMFDSLLTVAVLLGMLGLQELVQGNSLRGKLYFSLAIGLGILCKGPVVLIHLLPCALLVKLWANPVKLWPYYRHISIAIFFGIALALLWAVPAALVAGQDYANAIFWHQTADRTLGHEIHARHLFWYLQFLPLILFPWILHPILWQKFRLSACLVDQPTRFCWLWIVSGLLIFSILPSKQIHYLIPVLPPFALLTSKALLVQPKSNHCFLQELVLPLAFALVAVFLIFIAEIPWLAKYQWAQSLHADWGIGVLSIAVLMAILIWLQKEATVIVVASSVVLAVLLGFSCFFNYNGAAYNLKPAAEHLKSLTDQGFPCAFVGDYQGQLHFLGRITQPLATLSKDQATNWAKQHSNGFLLSLEKNKPQHASFIQPHREYWLVFRPAEQVSELDAR